MGDIQSGSHAMLMIPPHQKTPLHSATKRGHVDIAQILVEKGADFNFKDSYGVCE